RSPRATPSIGLATPCERSERRPCTPPNCSCRSHGCRLSPRGNEPRAASRESRAASPEPRDEIDAHAILMTIEPILLVATLIGGALVFAIGVFLGRMIGRPVSETSLRETFRALSHEALKSNNESFLSLAETKLGEARAKAAAEIDQRKAAIENLLT